MDTFIPAATPPIAPYVKAHDAFFRHVFAHPECQRGLLRYAWSELKLGTVSLDGAEITVVDASFAGGKSADLVLQVAISSPATTPPTVLVFEHKSNRDPRTMIQLLGYCVAVVGRERERHPEVVPIIFYHGPRRWKRIPAPPIAGLTFEPFMLDLRSFAPNSPAAGDAASGPRTTAALLVMARVRHVLTESSVREVLAHLTTAAIEDQFRRELLWYFTYHTPGVNRELILKLAAEPQYTTIGGEAMTMRQAYVLEGKEEGIEQTLRAIALNARRQGFDAETVARLTDLDVVAVERLAAEETVEEPDGNESQ